MSGHSKWSTIKHKKAINDAKKGKIFSRLSVLITMAARHGGGDPSMNPSLRLLLDEAKREGFPAENVKRAVDKGTGGGTDSHYEEASYEGFGPGNIAIIVDVLTTNTNRTVAEIRKMMTDVGGRMAETGAVSWNFDTVGWVNVRPGKMVKGEKFGQDDQFKEENKDEVMLAIMDIEGVNDIKDGDEGTLDIYTKFEDMGKVRDAILGLGFVVNKAQIAKVPKMFKKLSGESLEKAVLALETLEEYEDVQNVWTDLTE